MAKQRGRDGFKDTDQLTYNSNDSFMRSSPHKSHGLFTRQHSSDSTLPKTSHEYPFLPAKLQQREKGEDVYFHHEVVETRFVKK